ncbi:heme-dependent oxidative N-demethylase family protein [Sulfitobacter donghicola]|uniref:DUF3445 domain-containing protein n=1 Tax=Sulfitobacter donghicola DSW-25 = KCTC 12864 = JCM 14565 TaxID=1300350 RepID=A0A073IK58_9RHOB|nr:DUF3445 domain-containing protein [Sulfitobacter donghicola]KEJ90124.1 hypothetical protein DSW25_07955 [Sulfitobacter donghicola DSW-25 = KCTC 12864 = JCM 14565]KIN66722.1 DUF3445 domain containing protein [Sulfitobacter donghicola DSW-25 = KCTC 12864 = JCM 14565]
MTEIVQDTLPEEMTAQVSLPGIAPAAPHDWLRVDEAYGAQMQRRLELIEHQTGDVLWMDPSALAVGQELLDEVLPLLPDLGFSLGHGRVTCPDGRDVTIDRHAPLKTLGQLVQEDFCLLRKEGDEHVLVGAVLCFPASWRLAEKAGKPLIAIHEPVEEYDAQLAKRVQRLFDGVRVGRPLWRFNRLWYDDPELHQPRSASSPRRITPDETAAPFIRSERQCLVRMPISQAVVFSIHTYVVRT